MFYWTLLQRPPLVRYQNVLNEGVLNTRMDSPLALLTAVLDTRNHL